MKRSKRKPHETIQKRMTVILLFFLTVYAALISRLFVLQIVQNRTYSALAAKQHAAVEAVFPQRGTIFIRDKDKNLIPLALNRSYATVAAVPKKIVNPQETAQFIADVLKIPEEDILLRLSKKDDPYEIIARKVTEENRAQIERKQIDGILFEEQKGRTYPYETVAAHLAGFVSRIDSRESGRYGIERFFDRDLQGEKGFLEGAKDAAGFWIALGRKIVHPSKNGSQVVLTIDYNIQSKAEDVLKTVKEKWNARSGAVVVIDPLSGDILAAAANPTFNPNEFSKEKDFSVFLNSLVELNYELGSVLKPITMAAGIEEGVVRPDSIYMDTGVVNINGYKIRNFDGRARGTQTMTEVIEKSLNTGAVHVAKLLGPRRQSDYLHAFGFGEKTGVELPGEVAGNLSNLKNGAGREIDFMTASFGQGIAVTPIQLAYAMGAIANGGNLMSPRIVAKVVDDSGNAQERHTEVKRRVISKETADIITKMLVSTVEKGFENKAGVKGYFVAGKTGTAQIPSNTGRGYSDKVIHTFAGYAPAFNPRFLVVLQLNEPIGNRFASNTLTPAFHDLAEYILNYLEVAPE